MLLVVDFGPHCTHNLYRTLSKYLVNKAYYKYMHIQGGSERRHRSRKNIQRRVNGEKVLIFWRDLKRISIRFVEVHQYNIYIF